MTSMGRLHAHSGPHTPHIHPERAWCLCSHAAADQACGWSGPVTCATDNLPHTFHAAPPPAAPARLQNTEARGSLASLLILREGAASTRLEASRTGKRFGTLLVQLPCSAKGVRVTMQPPGSGPSQEVTLPEVRSEIAWLAAYSDCAGILHPPPKGTALLLLMHLEAPTEVRGTRTGYAYACLCKGL